MGQLGRILLQRNIWPSTGHKYLDRAGIRSGSSLISAPYDLHHNSEHRSSCTYLRRVRSCSKASETVPDQQQCLQWESVVQERQLVANSEKIYLGHSRESNAAFHKVVPYSSDWNSARKKFPAIGTPRLFSSTNLVMFQLRRGSMADFGIGSPVASMRFGCLYTKNM